jgi:hypothetical protein
MVVVALADAAAVAACAFWIATSANLLAAELKLAISSSHLTMSFVASSD